MFVLQNITLQNSPNLCRNKHNYLFPLAVGQPQSQLDLFPAQLAQAAPHPLFRAVLQILQRLEESVTEEGG